MDSFILALQFLTVFPLRVKAVSEKKIAWAMVFFPLIGLFLGVFLWGISQLLFLLNFPLLVSSIILVVALAVITGGMHLDGLSDSADAFFSGKSREEMLGIMRDPHVGVMGVLSLICVIFLKAGLIFSLDAGLRATALLLACVLSRWSAVLAMFYFTYARREGKARVFIQGMNPRIFILSSLTALVLTLAIGNLKGLFALVIAAGCAYLFGRLAQRKIGGITGDTLGATIELTEIAVLFMICIA